MVDASQQIRNEERRGMRRMVVLILLCGVGLAALWFWLWRDSGVLLTLRNDSAETYRNLRVSYSGGVVTKSSLEANQVFQAKIRADAESHLVLECEDSLGRKQSAEVDVYFERGYSGEVVVMIGPGGKISWRDSLQAGRLR